LTWGKFGQFSCITIISTGNGDFCATTDFMLSIVFDHHYLSRVDNLSFIKLTKIIEVSIKGTGKKSGTNSTGWRSSNFFVKFKISLI
jgi:hypothetical protein